MANDKGKNMFDQIREVNAKERESEKEAERLAYEKHEREEKRIQDEYNKRLQRERVELMRLKQGVIEEPELVVQEEKVEKVYTLKEKYSNFMYHYKVYVIIIVALAVLVSFFIHDVVTNVRPDAYVLFICTDYELGEKTQEMENLFEQYATDKNEDGKVNVSISYMPIDDDSDPQVYQANITKLMGNLQIGDSMLIIANNETMDKIELGEYMVDLRDRYPDKDNISKTGILLKQTKFVDKLGVSDVKDDLVIGIKQIDDSAKDKVKKNYEFALSILDKFVEDLC